MAIWQFDLTLLPPTDEHAAPDGSPAWPDDRRRAIEALLDAHLLRGRSRSPDHLSWGREYGGRVDLFLTGDKLIEVSCRIDMRVDTRRMLDLMVPLAEAAGADTFTTADDVPIPAAPASLLAAAASSRAARFVRDAMTYFRSLDDDPIEDHP